MTEIEAARAIVEAINGLTDAVYMFAFSSGIVGFVIAAGLLAAAWNIERIGR